MNKYGRLVTCDRCGTEIFLNRLGEKEQDGGFTKYHEYEPYPDDWEHTLEGMDLCPTCNAYYEKMMERFYSDPYWDCGVVGTFHFDAHLNDAPAEAFKNMTRDAEIAANMIKHMQVDG